jgi:hypothetical protein
MRGRRVGADGARATGGGSIMTKRSIAIALALGAALALGGRARADEKGKRITDVQLKGNGVELEFQDKGKVEIPCPVSFTYYEEFNDGKKLHESGVFTKQYNTAQDLRVHLGALPGVHNLVDYKPPAKGQKEGTLEVQVVLSGKVVGLSVFNEDVRIFGLAAEETLTVPLEVYISSSGAEDSFMLYRTTEQMQGLGQRLEAFKKVGAVAINWDAPRKGASYNSLSVLRVHFLIPKK